MDLADKIRNSNLLTEIFGEWPSFHDAQVLKIVLDRAPSGEFCGPALEAYIHVFEITSEVDKDGFYKLTNHTHVELAFLEIDELSLEDFNHQNVLNSLIVRKTLEGYDLILYGIYGVSASISSRYLRVELSPWQP